jgi:ATP phosphoribosyltransferase regulatory subunit
VRLEAPLPPTALAAIREPFVEAGGVALDAPLLQPLGLLLDLAGEALRERLFVVQGEGGPESCLRPDFTIPAMRAHIASGASSGRYFYEGHAFRVAPPGSLRAEEFLQIGLEAFEAGEAWRADAEMAAMAWRAASAGGRTDLTLVLGDVGLFSAFAHAIGIADPLAGRLKRAFASPRRLQAELAAGLTDDAPAIHGDQRLAAMLARLSEDDAVGVLEEIWALSGIVPVGGREPREIVHRLVERAALPGAPRLNADQAALIGAYLAIADRPRAALAQIAALAPAASLAGTLDTWGRRLDALGEVGAPAEAMSFSAAFGRAFGYYDGALFEVRSAALGEDQPVAAGGRYDGLPAQLGARLETGAVGCMVRPGRAWVGAGS